VVTGTTKSWIHGVTAMTLSLTQTELGRPALCHSAPIEDARRVAPALSRRLDRLPCEVTSRPLVDSALDWRHGLPVLYGTRVTLRELRRSDAPSLLRLLSTEEVGRFITPPPTTVEQFETFIRWTEHRRREGRHVCFGVVPEGTDAAVGIFQVRAIGDGFVTADWGFAIGAPFWGTGVFLDAAQLTLRFAFDDLGVWRLEAKAMEANGRGNGALRKVGAVLEGRLPQSFMKDGELHDQTTWATLEPEWRQQNGVWRRRSVLDAPALSSVSPH
jgi:RimJ/RimL family protein N-acetyltransferase